MKIIKSHFKIRKTPKSDFKISKITKPNFRIQETPKLDFQNQILKFGRLKKTDFEIRYLL